MDVTFDDDELERLYSEPAFTMKLPQAIVRKFRQRIQEIESAPDERDLRALPSLHFEQLKGNRAGECSVRLNKQYRLVFTISTQGARKTVNIRGIEDYH